MLARTKELINFGLNNRRNTFVYFAPPSTRKYRTYYFQLRGVKVPLMTLEQQPTNDISSGTNRRHAVTSTIVSNECKESIAEDSSLEIGEMIELIVWGLESATDNITQQLCGSIEQRTCNSYRPIVLFLCKKLDWAVQ